MHFPFRLLDKIADVAIALARKHRMVQDAITIHIESARLSRGKVSFASDDPFFVQYCFISHNVTTYLTCAYTGGTIAVGHASSFLILSTNKGSLEPVLWALSRMNIKFALFVGDRQENERGKWEEDGYQLVGHAKVPLSSIWSPMKNTTTTTTVEIISPEARILWSMSVVIKNNVKPAFSGINVYTMRRTAHSHFVILLKEVVLTIKGDDSLMKH